MVCKDPSVFKMSPEVCGTCGDLLESHAEKDKKYQLPLKQALWKVLLERGGYWNQYGGDFEKARTVQAAPRRAAWRNQMAKLIFHLEDCGLDWDRVEMPFIDDELYVFTGTFDEHKEYAVGIVGTAICKCGEYDRWDENIGIKDLTLGQLIWLAVHADD